MLVAAADSGDKASLTSTHAQALPNCVMEAMAVRPNEVCRVNAAAKYSVHLGHAGGKKVPGLV
jgi:hypothetical protein